MTYRNKREFEHSGCHFFTHHDRLFLLIFILDCISLGTSMFDDALKLFMIQGVDYIEEVGLVNLLTYWKLFWKVLHHFFSLRKFIV